jgi:hypothetical protein
MTYKYLPSAGRAGFYSHAPTHHADPEMDVRPFAERYRLDLAAAPPHSPAMTLANPDSAATIEDTILALCAGTKPGRTICPTDAAQAFAAARGEGQLGWRLHLQEVRRAAVRLAEGGQIVIYRKGKPVDPKDFRGVYRLGAPRSD